MWKWVGDVSWKLFESVKISTGAFYFAPKSLRQHEWSRKTPICLPDRFKKFQRVTPTWHWRTTLLLLKGGLHFWLSSQFGSTGVFHFKAETAGICLCVCVFQVATQNISKLGAANVHLIYQFMASRKCWSMSRWFANPLFSKPRCKGVGETWRLQANSPGIGLDLEQNLTPGAPFFSLENDRLSKGVGCMITTIIQQRDQQSLCLRKIGNLYGNLATHLQRDHMSRVHGRYSLRSLIWCDMHLLNLGDRLRQSPEPVLRESSPEASTLSSTADFPNKIHPLMIMLLGRILNSSSDWIILQDPSIAILSLDDISLKSLDAMTVPPGVRSASVRRRPWNSG